MQKEVILTIGFFDGVHIGHRKLINYVVDFAKKNDCVSLVTTFDKVLKVKKGLIFSLEQRVKKIKSLGIKSIEVLKFDRIKNFSAREFFKKIILSKKVKTIIIGQDFRFGYKRQGSVKILKQLCKNSNISLMVIKHLCMNIDGKKTKISSTLIRKSILEGKFKLVENLLGEKYIISGIKVKGYGLGRKLGVPTINFFPKQNLVLPMGVIAGECILGDKGYPAVANIGNSPTIKNLKKTICEVHILSKNFKENSIVFFRPIKKIREEKKFENIELLKKYMYRDISIAKKILTKKYFGGNYAS